MLNGGADVFRCIAAEWKSVDPETVNDNLRQQAKQVHQGRKDAKKTLVMPAFSMGISSVCTCFSVFTDLLWYYLWDGG